MKFTKKLVGIQYKSREERNKFVVSELGEAYIGETVLNVGGGGESHMKKYLNDNVSYIEIDIAGTPDLKINLERELPIPVKENSYDTVICTDVLEHLDNFHDVFNELLRVTRKNLITSLPNSAKNISSYYKDKVYKNNHTSRRVQYGKYQKFYGLPFESPKDRHKWFFSYVEAEEFFEYQSEKKSFKIKEMFPVGYYANDRRIKAKMLNGIINLLFNDNAKKNILSSSFWIVIEK